MKLNLWGTVLGLLINNIPAFILLVVLLISWKHEIVGGIAFILAGILYVVIIMSRNSFELYMVSWILIVAGPAFLIGILFITSGLRKKNNRNGTMTV